MLHSGLKYLFKILKYSESNSFEPQKMSKNRLYFLSSTFIIEDSSKLVGNNSIENQISYKFVLVQIFCRSVTFLNNRKKPSKLPFFSSFQGEGDKVTENCYDYSIFNKKIYKFCEIQSWYSIMTSRKDKFFHFSS